MCRRDFGTKASGGNATSRNTNAEWERASVTPGSRPGGGSGALSMAPGGGTPAGGGV